MSLLCNRRRSRRFLPPNAAAAQLKLRPCVRRAAAVKRLGFCNSLQRL
jgi:hypothetical protein